MERSVLEQRITFRRRILTQLYEAYEALAGGRVKSYMIDDRQLTYHSLPELRKEIQNAEKELDELTAALDGRRPRLSVGTVPRDW